MSCIRVLLVYFCSAGKQVQGPGTRTPWPPASVSQSLHFMRSLYDCLGCRTSTGCLLSLPRFAFIGWNRPFSPFLPFLGCQLMPVNTNNKDASAFHLQLQKEILAPAELWLFTISWLLMMLQNIPHTNAMPGSRSQDKIFHFFFTYGVIFLQDLM